MVNVKMIYNYICGVITPMPNVAMNRPMTGNWEIDTHKNTFTFIMSHTFSPENHKDPQSHKSKNIELNDHPFYTLKMFRSVVLTANI